MVWREHRLVVGRGLRGLSRVTRWQSRGELVGWALVEKSVISWPRRNVRLVVRPCPRTRSLRLEELIVREGLVVLDLRVLAPRWG